MASGRISIPVGLETSGVAKGADTAEKALKDLDEAVRDTGTGGARDIGKLEAELVDVQKQSKKTERAIADIDSEGTRKASEGMADFKGEADQTAREVAASFDGSVESIAGGFQELSANALAAFGPAGAIAGLAGAAGIGLITAEFEKQQEQARILTERIGSMYQSAAEKGLKYVDTLDIVADAQDLVFNPDRADEYKRVQETQQLTGLAMSTILKANAGDLSAIQLVQGRVADEIDEQIEANRRAGESANYSRELQTVEDWWRKVGTAAEDQRTKADKSVSATTELLVGMINQAEGATVEVDALGNELYTLPTGQQILIDAETKQATQDISTFKGDVDEKTQPVTQKVKVVVDDRAWREWHPPLKEGAVRVSYRPAWDTAGVINGP